MALARSLGPSWISFAASSDAVSCLVGPLPTAMSVWCLTARIWLVTIWAVHWVACPDRTSVAFMLLLLAVQTVVHDVARAQLLGRAFLRLAFTRGSFYASWVELVRFGCLALFLSSGWSLSTVPALAAVLRMLTFITCFYLTWWHFEHSWIGCPCWRWVCCVWGGRGLRALPSARLLSFCGVRLRRGGALCCFSR